MSLRVRLIACIACVLLAGLVAGGALAGWHVARSVRAEMRAALAVGERAVRLAVEGPPGSRDPSAELGRLVRAFDGDRHLRAVLRDGAGRVLAASDPAAPAPGIPGWYVRLVAPDLAPVRVPVAGGAPAAPPGAPDEAAGGMAVALEPDPRNEAGEAWPPLRDGLLVAALFCAGAAGLVWLVVERALRPLRRVAAALDAVGRGEYGVRVPHVGPPELARLARGFNAMAERLGAAEAHSRRLHRRLAALRDEERAELARDLHDEVGPFLFAVGLDAAAIERATAGGRHAEVPGHARAIRDAVGHMQRHVRAMLKRLRPASPVEAGLAPALGELVAFWRARRPTIAFVLDVAADEDGVGEPAKAVIYRVVQEALSNAVRHGRPGRIEAVVRACDGGPGGAGEVVVRVCDDGAGLSGAGAVGTGAADAGGGFGLAGMRERVAALGGSLHVGARADGTGLVVTARLPRAGAAGEAGRAIAA